jgi:hypothetical protein
MDFKSYSKTVSVEAAEIKLPEEIKQLAREKKSPTFLGAKVRHQPAYGDEPEKFDLLYKQNTEEVLLEEGDVFVKTSTGIVGVKKDAFEAEYGPVQSEQAPEEELIDVVITQEILDLNPGMVESGVKLGDTIQVPKSEEGDVQFALGLRTEALPPVE